VLVPVFVRVIDCEVVPPTATLPNAMLPGFAFSVAVADVPVPARSKVCGESLALSVNWMLPVTPSAVVGVNCTVNDALCPAVIVAGNVRPLIAKPLPITFAAVTTRSTFPLFDIATFCVALCPTFTLPKFNELGAIESSDAIPVPVKLISSGEFCASLSNV
jgi:hypothetical protein